MRAGRALPFALHHFSSGGILLLLASLHGSGGQQVMHDARAWPGGAMGMPDAHPEPLAPLTAMRSPRIFCTGLPRREAAATWSAFCC